MARARSALPVLGLALLLHAPEARAGWYDYMISQPAPRTAILIDPLLVLAGLYSGVIQVKPQVQYSPWRHIAVEVSPVFLYAYAKQGKVETSVIGGGGMAGLRFVLNHLRGLYLSTRAGPLGLKSDYVKRVIMLLEIELGWSWAPRRKGLIMNGGMGYQGYYPLDHESRLYYVAAHSFMINYAIGFGW
jgi:hypothetical protein